MGNKYAERNSIIAFPVSEEEKERIFQMAHNAGMTMSSYIRGVLCGSVRIKEVRE